MFRLDLRLATDTYPVAVLGLCEVRLKRGTPRNPWLILVPQRKGLVELHDMDETDRHRLADEIAHVGRALKRVAACDKINVAAFGNSVPQLHVHVIARFASDDWWPGPIDMTAAPRDWERQSLETFCNELKAAL